MNALLLKNSKQKVITNLLVKIFFSPITEEGLLIGVSIVVILILVGLIFGIFNWISNSINVLFDQLGIG